jgi:hypothetical protein
LLAIGQAKKLMSPIYPPVATGVQNDTVRPLTPFAFPKGADVGQKKEVGHSEMQVIKAEKQQHTTERKATEANKALPSSDGNVACESLLSSTFLPVSPT